eukprot:4850981-Pleurochrysis_carterae.AAC.1
MGAAGSGRPVPTRFPPRANALRGSITLLLLPACPQPPLHVFAFPCPFDVHWRTLSPAMGSLPSR